MHLGNRETTASEQLASVCTIWALPSAAVTVLQASERAELSSGSE